MPSHDNIRSTKELIEAGLEPVRVKAPAGLYSAFYEAAMDTLRKGTPGLTDLTRSTLARSIAMKCERVVKQQSQERAA